MSKRGFGAIGITPSHAKGEGLLANQDTTSMMSKSPMAVGTGLLTSKF